MKTLASKLEGLFGNQQTIEEISVATIRYGAHVKFGLIRSLVKGKSVNPARNRVVSLAKALNTPVRYLADDSVVTPLAAVIAEAKLLCAEDQKRLIHELSVMQSVLIG